MLTHLRRICHARNDSARIQLPEQPRTGVSPIALGCCARNAKHLSRLLHEDAPHRSGGSRKEVAAAVPPIPSPFCDAENFAELPTSRS